MLLLKVQLLLLLRLLLLFLTCSLPVVHDTISLWFKVL